MIRRILAAIAVLSGTIVWANCEKVFPLTDPPAPNKYFDGCFQGPITDPAGLGTVIIVLVADTDPESRLILTGCMRLSRSGQSDENGPLSGMVLETDREQARVTVMPSSSSSTYMLLVQRSPTGNSDATSVTLSNDDVAPFATAANLLSCPVTVPKTDCQTLGIPVPFMPGGGLP
jgi:hypothetical protein